MDSRQVIKRLLGFIRPHGGFVAGALLCAVGGISHMAGLRGLGTHGDICVVIYDSQSISLPSAISAAYRKLF